MAPTPYSHFSIYFFYYTFIYLVLKYLPQHDRYVLFLRALLRSVHLNNINQTLKAMPCHLDRSTSLAFSFFKALSKFLLSLESSNTFKFDFLVIESIPFTYEWSRAFTYRHTNTANINAISKTHSTQYFFFFFWKF